MVSDNIELASAYRLTATSFRMSAEVLERQFKEHGEGMPLNYRSTPYYYLISHACELLLKAALLKRGLSTEELRKFTLRHNLKGLVDSLASTGLNLSEHSLKLIEGLSSQHESHDLRYTALLDDGKLTYTPEPTEIYEMLDELLMTTRLIR
jgi:hypothetical protein